MMMLQVTFCLFMGEFLNHQLQQPWKSGLTGEILGWSERRPEGRGSEGLRRPLSTRNLCDQTLGSLPEQVDQLAYLKAEELLSLREHAKIHICYHQRWRHWFGSVF